MGHYSLMPTHDYVSAETGTTVPHYRYFDNSEVVNYTNNFTWLVNSQGDVWDPICNCHVPSTTLQMVPHFHGLSNWTHGDVNDPGSMTNSSNGIRFIKFNQYLNPTGTQYLAANGTLLTEPYVYAMQKYTGWWRQHMLYSQTDPTNNPIYIANDCGNDLNWAISKMNGEDSNIEWYQSSNPYTYPHPYSLPNVMCDGSGFNDCGYSQMYFDNIFEFENNGTDWWFAQVLNHFWSCLDIVGLTPGTGGSSGGVTTGNTAASIILANAEFISFSQRDGSNTVPVFYYTHSDLIGNDGSANSLSGPVLQQGLYELAFKLPGQIPTKLIFENRNTISTSIPLSTYFSATVFPVPIVAENSFSIHAQATAQLRVLYELRDSSGNLLFSQNVLLPQGHNAYHQITTPNPLPNGLLIHRFIFEDGSLHSIPTIK